MRPRDLHRYLNDVGWADSPVPPEGPPAVRNAGTQSAAGTLDVLRESAEGCGLCRLSEKRRSVVFGEGHSDAPLMFVGEAPGAEEDRTGRPFVGQAGKLLDAMIFAMGFDRSGVYIANVVKCRPPGNRDPEEDEMAACAEFLDRQIELIKPRVLVALGKPASHRLTGTAKAMGALRGRWASYRGIPLMPVFHPAYLLRQPKLKREAWADLKLVMERLESASTD